jgi:nucleoside-diphosphate-sugar epimerase
MARSDAGAKSLAAAGAQVHRGELTDLESLRSGAAISDGVIHTAFIHDFANFKSNCEIDRQAIETLGGALAGTDRPLLITSGTGMVSGVSGKLVTEEAVHASGPNAIPRVASEEAADAVAARGVRVSVMRLLQVHDRVKQGLVTYMVSLAREKGVSAYVDEGLNRWPAVHVLDAARLYRIAIEKQVAGARYHALGEEAVPCREIAEAIGRALNIPVVSKSREAAAAHFGWLAMFVALDMPASSKLTQERLGWRPTGPGLISDLEKMQYAAA